MFCYGHKLELLGIQFEQDQKSTRYDGSNIKDPRDVTHSLKCFLKIPISGSSCSYMYVYVSIIKLLKAVGNSIY